MVLCDSLRTIQERILRNHSLRPFLAVRKSLDDRRVTRVLKVCQQVIATFSRSWKKKRDLAKAQHEKQLLLHSLKANSVTRWGSSLAMLERITEQQEAIRIVLASDRKVSHLIPT